MKKSNSTQSVASDNTSKIKQAYREYLLTNGQNPTSVFLFCKNIGLEESTFYEYFNSFDAICASIWHELVASTILKIKKEITWAEYTAREKLLAFLFTYIEELKAQRSFITATFDSKRAYIGKMPQLTEAKNEFMTFAKELLIQGFENRELKNRQFISDRYPDLMWFKLLFITDFWLRDTSKGFEQTDAAIEKSVNLIFELLGQNTIDYLVDFAKFMFSAK